VKLGTEKIESLIRAAEHAARTYIVSRLQKSEVEDLEITVEVETDGDLSFDVDVDLDVVQDKDIYQGLVDGAVEAAHAVIKSELDKLSGR
jgi:fructose-specific phosphotransferase system component IIB